MRGANGGHIGAGGWKARIKHAGGAVVVGAVWADTLASVASDAVVTRGVEDGGALEAEFHVFVALADFIGGSEVGFVIAVRGGDYFRGGEAATILRTGVATVEGVRIGRILSRVIAALIGAVRAVDGVEEGVEGSTFDQVAHLVKSYWLRINQGHSVLKVEIRFAVVFEAFRLGLYDGSVHKVRCGSDLLLIFGKVGEEHVKISLEIGFGSVLDDPIVYQLVHNSIRRGASN